MSGEGARHWSVGGLLRLLGGLGGGIAVGVVVGVLVPGGVHGGGGQPVVPFWLCVPFIGLLLGIAVMPFVHRAWWHRWHGETAVALAGLMTGYYLGALGGYGVQRVLHAAEEYYAFIALVGGLYVASGGIVLNIRGRATPMRNTGLLALGAVLANVVGTTGASVLLIRPFMRLNRGRLRPMHIVMFIFIVSNCGGCLTPVGDPPLYLGYLKGVPFVWSLRHLWPMWVGVNGMLLAIFFAIDSALPRAKDAVDEVDAGHPLVIGWKALGCLLLLVAGAFVDPLIARLGPGPLVDVPVGPTFQILVAGLAYAVSGRGERLANRFSFEPVREVGLLFIGIFMTMMPALAYLEAHAGGYGLSSPTHFYFATGLVSAVLDNAPTYLSFLQVGLGTNGLALTPEGVRQFIGSGQGQLTLEAVSLGAVFFGAMTYIGNGPNFMVKSMVEADEEDGDPATPERPHLEMPSFFSYVLLAAGILLPVLVLNWVVFIR